MGPAAQLLSAIPSVASSGGSLDRIQQYLLAESWQDQRVIMGDPSRSPTEMSHIELQEIRSRTINESGTAISIDNASICHSANSEPVLVNINLNIEIASITMLVGPVGSGKSTLMKAILGELPCNGMTIASRDIAYCAQVPWMLNSSVRENICGLNKDTPIDEEWYQQVVHSCALDQDISQLRDADQTIVGSRGTVMSGGQKQRLVCINQ